MFRNESEKAVPCLLRTTMFTHRLEKLRRIRRSISLEIGGVVEFSCRILYCINVSELEIFINRFKVEFVLIFSTSLLVRSADNNTFVRTE